MAKHHNFTMQGHPSLYTYKDRRLNIYFSEPDSGVNKDTGILLLIAGFGANANSNVYKKMRDRFADKYNLVIIQCDYIGWEFMQEPKNFTFCKEQLKRQFTEEEFKYIFTNQDIMKTLIETAGKKKVRLVAKEKLEETLDNFNDMGLIQAVDNISSVLAVMDIIKDNGYEFNENKIVAYGQSQGAYLAYLCNAFAPYLFSLLIDNSSWIFPLYLIKNRLFEVSGIGVEFNYLAKDLDYDEEILDLVKLYKKFENRCKIICYHGTDDNLISHKDKVILKKVIKNFEYNEIDFYKVDNKIFYSNTHGLGADFFELFYHVMDNYKENFIREDKEKSVVTYETSKCWYEIDYSRGLPIIIMEKKG